MAKRVLGAVGVAMRRSGRYAMNVLEFETKLDFGLVAREIREIQCAGNFDSPTSHLRAPSRYHPRPRGEPRE